MVEFKTTEDGMNITQTRMGITETRIHPDYITYYRMWTRLLAIGIFPLAMLAILNTKIYLALRRSKAQLRSMAIRSALPMAILGKKYNYNLSKPPYQHHKDVRFLLLIFYSVLTQRKFEIGVNFSILKLVTQS